MHFVGNSTWFAALLVVHVLGAIAGIGSSYSFAVLGPLAGKLGGPGGLGILEGMEKVEKAEVLPVALTTQWISGVLMIFNRGLNHGFFSAHRAWLLAAIGIYILVIALALGVNFPVVKRMIALGKAGNVGEEFKRNAATAAKIGPVITLLVTIIVVLMVWKPGSGCGPAFRC